MARVLLVDDDQDLVEVLEEVLVAADHEVRTANDGAEALRALEAWRPDVLLLDVDMPIMDGPTMVGALSASGVRLPIVLMSGHANARRIAAALGVPHCLTKPIGMDVLLSTLEAARRP